MRYDILKPQPEEVGLYLAAKYDDDVDSRESIDTPKVVLSLLWYGGHDHNVLVLTVLLPAAPPVVHSFLACCLHHAERSTSREDVGDGTGLGTARGKEKIGAVTCARPAATAYTDDVSHQASEPGNLAENLCHLGPGWEGGAAPVGRLPAIALFPSSPFHRALRIPRSGPPESCFLHRTRWQTSKEPSPSADLPFRQKASSTRVDRERNRPLRYPSVRLCGHVPPTITREGKESFRAGGLDPSEASVRNLRTRGDVAGSTSATSDRCPL
ncbi:hypothetical protein B0T20DRAFT_397139 [Sordaria brevicollis]|uniref:Uncharacterized protein n=1 Tax=Sordaria brevicollis TaxID=83679 RepID=A0AAE0NW79_SORBR|nr:hypothetical protein B0T20DRAFT_397139 [Sordaria brevicollis]